MPTTIHYDNGTSWVAAGVPQGKLYYDNGTTWDPVDNVAPELAAFAVTQSKVAASGALVTTLSATLDSSCDVGSLLVADLSIDKQGTAITVSSGWTMIQTPYSGTSVSKAWAYRIADGTATDRTATFTWSSARGAVVGMMETNLYNAAIVGTPFVDGTEVGAGDRWFDLGAAPTDGLFLAGVSLDSLADASDFTWDNGIELLVARGGPASGSVAGTLGGFLVENGSPMTAHVAHPNDRVVSFAVLFSGTTSLIPGAFTVPGVKATATATARTPVIGTSTSVAGGGPATATATAPPPVVPPPVGVTVLHSEAFTGTDGAAWPAQWVAGVTGTSATATIQGNAGRLRTTGGSYSGAFKIHRRLNATLTDFDAVQEFWSGDSVEKFPRLKWRAPDSTIDGLGGYEVMLSSNPVAYRTANYSGTSMGSTTFAMTTGTHYWVRVRVVGSSHKIKLWGTSLASEPLTGGVDGNGFQISFTDSTHSSGYFGYTLAVGGTAATSDFYVDNLSITTP